VSLDEADIPSLAANKAASLPDLPESWVWATPEDLASDDQYSLAIGPFGSNLKVEDYRDGGVPLVFVRNIRSRSFDGPVTRYVSPRKADELKAHWVDPGDVLITKMGDPPGDACIYPTGRPMAVITADCIKFRVNRTILEPKFSEYAINSDIVRQQMLGITQGVAQLKVSLARFKTIALPLPPLNEQRRIVAEIETQFTRLDAAVAALERSRANLKRYRAAVLKAACEGRLVPTEAEIARAQGRDFESGELLLDRIAEERRLIGGNGRRSRNEEPAKLESDHMVTLPMGWSSARAEQICDFITKGTTPAAYKLHDGAGDIPFIKVYNLTTNGRLDFSFKPTFISVDTHEQELGRSRVRPGDVLMNIVGPPLGKVSIVPDTYPEWNMNQAVAVFRPMPSYDRRFLSICLLNDETVSWAIRRAKATAGQFNLTLEICRDLPLPVPPLAEQHRIVAEVERRLSVVEEMEKTIDANLKRAERLRQAILARAFAGKLVPQDPTDGPASVLLERIRAQRTNEESSIGRSPRNRKKQATQPELW
jgi:type I restriction enzyme, S subunit